MNFTFFGTVTILMLTKRRLMITVITMVRTIKMLAYFDSVKIFYIILVVAQPYVRFNVKF